MLVAHQSAHSSWRIGAVLCRVCPHVRKHPSAYSCACMRAQFSIESHVCHHGVALCLCKTGRVGPAMCSGSPPRRRPSTAWLLYALYRITLAPYHIKQLYACRSGSSVAFVGTSIHTQQLNILHSPTTKTNRPTQQHSHQPRSAHFSPPSMPSARIALSHHPADGERVVQHCS